MPGEEPAGGAPTPDVPESQRAARPPAQAPADVPADVPAEGLADAPVEAPADVATEPAPGAPAEPASGAQPAHKGPPGLQVRWAHRGEAPKVYPLFKALVEAEGAVAPGPGAFSRGFGSTFRPESRHRFAVAVAEDEPRQPIACMSLHAHVSTWRGAPVVSLEDFFVVPERRGQGVGSAMLAFAEASAARIGAARLELHVRTDNPRAEALYAREGWEVQPYRWMHKSLPAPPGSAPAGSARADHAPVSLFPAEASEEEQRRPRAGSRSGRGPARGSGRGAAGRGRGGDRTRGDDRGGGRKGPGPRGRAGRGR